MSNRAFNQELWVFYVFTKFKIENHTGLMDSWKSLIVFFFWKPKKSKNAHSIVKKTYGIFVKFTKKFQFLLLNSKKCNLQKWPLEVK